MQRQKRIVVKIGTKVITSRDGILDKERVRAIVEQICDVKAKGMDVLLVTSGAIGAGIGLLGLKKRPAKLSELQATASVGQVHLMDVYTEYFKSKSYIVGQILLTQEDFNSRRRHSNIKHTIETLLSHKVVPIVNENDTVSTDEIKFGDNDALAGLVSDLCQADKLILLTDVDGLLDEDCKVIPVVRKITPKIMKLARSSVCDMGTGGMLTKLEAACRATEAGIECVIANGRAKDIIVDILEGRGAGTVFKSAKTKTSARKRWIAFSSKPKGVLLVDGGAEEALKIKDKSLLASGILSVEGRFNSGDRFGIAGKDGREFARGLTNYSSDEISKIEGERWRL